MRAGFAKGPPSGPFKAGSGTAEDCPALDQWSRARQRPLNVVWLADGTGESRLKPERRCLLARAVRRDKMPECPEIGKWRGSYDP